MEEETTKADERDTLWGKISQQKLRHCSRKYKVMGRTRYPIPYRIGSSMFGGIGFS